MFEMVWLLPSQRTAPWRLGLMRGLKVISDPCKEKRSPCILLPDQSHSSTFTEPLPTHLSLFLFFFDCYLLLTEVMDNYQATF